MSFKVRVRYQETDQMGRVYHANYFVWLDLARTEFFRDLGFAYKEMEKQGFFLVVVDAQCKYLSPAVFDDELEIKLKIEKIKGVTLDISYEIYNQNNLFLAKAFTRLACLNNLGKPQRLDHQLVAVLEKKNNMDL